MRTKYYEITFKGKTTFEPKYDIKPFKYESLFNMKYLKYFVKCDFVLCRVVFNCVSYFEYFIFNNDSYLNGLMSYLGSNVVLPLNVIS